MRFFNEATSELQDRKIVEALRRAADLYDDGAIIETRDILVDIVVAINEFDKRQEA